MRKSSRHRMWLQGIIAAVIIPAAILVLTELVLRITGYGYDPKAIIPCQVKGQKAYRGNDRYSWRFFPGYIAREFPPFIFPGEKSDTTFRVFVVGASAARGEPAKEYSFWRMIQVMLDERYPGVDFEVIPVAMAAINSHVCREIVHECNKHAPDLFIVYLGNNEVIGPYGAATVFSPLRKSQTVIRISISLRATRLAQLLTNIIRSLRSESAIKVWKGMELFIDRPVRADDPELTFVYKHFEKNLEVIRDSARKSGSQIILCTVATNLKDNPPFDSVHRSGLGVEDTERWRQLYLQGRQLAEQGHYDESLARYVEAAEIDTNYAELQFSMGDCYWHKGDYRKAKQKFMLSRDLDVHRFRADGRMNEIIDQVVEGHDDSVHLLEAENLINAESPHGISGNELFLDHVHLSFEGNYILAKALCAQIDELLPGDMRNKGRDKGLLSLSECQRRLGYTDWNRINILIAIMGGFFSRPPFTNQLGHDRRVKEIEQEIQRLQKSLSRDAMWAIYEQYKGVVQEYPDDVYLRMIFADFLVKIPQALKPAMEQYERVLESYPFHSEAYGRLGEIQGRLGDIEAAITSNQKALQYSPYNFVALYNLGVAYNLRGNTDEAVKHFKNATLREPYFEQAHNSLGTTLAENRKLDQAVEAFQRGLQFIPDSQLLRLNLALTHLELGNKEEAVNQINAVLKADPQSEEALELLRRVRQY